MFADELAKMEVKFKEQLKTNENLKLQLASEEDRYKVGSSYRRSKVQTLSTALRLPLDTCVFLPLCMAGLAQGSSL